MRAASSLASWWREASSRVDFCGRPVPVVVLVRPVRDYFLATGYNLSDSSPIWTGARGGRWELESARDPGEERAIG